MARDEAERGLRAEKDVHASLLDEIDHLTDQLSTTQEQLERSDSARGEAETRAMALASQMTVAQGDISHHLLVHSSHQAEIAMLEKQVKELEELLAAAKDSEVVVATAGSQTIPPNPVTEHSCQTIPPNPVTEHSCQTIPPNPVTEHSCQTIPPNPVTEHSCQTTQSNNDMSTNTTIDIPFATSNGGGGGNNRFTTTKLTPTTDVSQLQMKITALSTELAGRLEAQVTPLCSILYINPYAPCHIILPLVSYPV